MTTLLNINSIESIINPSLLINMLLLIPIIILIVLTIISILLIIVTKLTPTPIALLARKTIFSGDANAQPFNDYDLTKSDVTIINDLKYDTKQLTTYDVYHRNIPIISNNPTIIWVHGGGFVGSDKAILKYYATTLASVGYTIFAINYSLAPEMKYPSPINDLAKFIEHLKIIDIDIPYNINNLFLVGDSAGAQIISQFAITQTNQDYLKSSNFKKVLDHKQIRGLILLCGPYDFREINSVSSKLIKFIFTQIGWSYFNDKKWINTNNVIQASVIENITINFPVSYITDGNTASFEAMGKQLEQTLLSNDVKVQSRFFAKETEGKLLHEFQFVMNTKAGEIVYNDIIKFLEANQIT